LIGVLAAIFCASGHAADFLSTQGRQIVDASGKPLQLRGINLGNWLVPEGYMLKIDKVNSPRLIDTMFTELIGPSATRDFWRVYQDTFITREDIQFIKQSGLNSVRVPFSYASFDQPAAAPPAESRGFELLDRVIGWCREADLYVVLDLHCASGGQTGDNIDDSFAYPWLFESEPDQKATVELWRKIARRYRDEKIVAAYDLLNEPIAHFFDEKKLNPRLEPLYRRMTSAIRESDPRHLIIVEGPQWASKFSNFGPPFDRKLVYSFHKYWTDPTESVIQEYLDYSRKHSVPLYLGESGENTDEWIGKFRAVLDKHEISWAFWPYKKMEATSCMLRFSKPAHYDEVIAYANAPRQTLEQVRAAREKAPHAREALKNLLGAIPAAHCRTNNGFVQALGLK
jgi:endoglucanase